MCIYLRDIYNSRNKACNTHFFFLHPETNNTNSAQFYLKSSRIYSYPYAKTMTRTAKQVALRPSHNPPFLPTPAWGRLSRKGNDPTTSDHDPPKHTISPKLALCWLQKTRIPGTIVHGIVLFLAGWIAIISGYYNIFFSDFYLYFYRALLFLLTRNLIYLLYI